MNFPIPSFIPVPGAETMQLISIVSLIVGICVTVVGVLFLFANCQVKCKDLWKKNSKGDFQLRHLRGLRFSLSVNLSSKSCEKGTL